MAAPVVIDFQVGGIKNVMDAFKSIQKTVADLGRATTRVSAEQERAFRREAAERLKGDREVKAAIRERERLRKEEARSEARTAKEMADGFRRAERERLREARESARERLRIEKDSQRELLRLERESRRTREQWARTVGGSVRGAVSRTATMGGLALGVAGGFSATDAVQTEIRNKGTAFDIALSRSSGRAIGKDEVFDSAGKAALAFGYDRQTALDGMQKFVSKTGNAGMGADALAGLAEVARATGSSLNDVADAAGDIFSTDTTMGADRLIKQVGSIAIQGRKGAVEMRDLASQMAKLTAGASYFGGDTDANVLKMGALAQLARNAKGGAASADEAATSAQRFGSDVAGHADKFAKLGIKVKDGKVLRQADDIIVDTLRATGGDVTKLTDLFGERSVRAVNAAAYTYRQAGGGKAGEQAVRAQFADLASLEKERGQLKGQASSRMQSVDMRMAAAIEALRQKVAEKLLPVFERLVEKADQLIPMFVRIVEKGAAFASWFIQNPIKGIGAVILAQVARDVAAAGIGKAIESIILRAAGGGGGGFGALGGAVGGKGAGLLNGVLGMVGAGLAIKATVDEVDATYKDAGDFISTGNALSANALSAQARLRSGNATDEDRAKAQAYAQEIQAKLAGHANKSWVSKSIEGIGGGISMLKGEEDAMQGTIAEHRTVSELKTALDGLTTALQNPTIRDTLTESPSRESAIGTKSRGGAI